MEKCLVIHCKKFLKADVVAALWLVGLEKEFKPTDSDFDIIKGYNLMSERQEKEFWDIIDSYEIKEDNK